MFRVGFGQDSHRFAKTGGRKLVLGGVYIPGAIGLAGNSDADVVLHALCRALEQAIGQDGFSRYADEMSRRGIDDSRQYVAVALARVADAGYRVNNVGVSIEAHTPRIDPVRAEMKTSIATLLGIAEDAVGINATTGEGLTPFGQAQGVQAFCIVSLVKSP